MRSDICPKGHDKTVEGRRPDGACRACYLVVQRRHARRQYRAMQALLRSTKLQRGCAHCGYADDWRALEFDHIEAVGDSRDRRTKSVAEARRLISDPNVQVLCANCHRIKTHRNRDWAKRREVA